MPSTDRDPWFHHPGRFGDCIYALYTVRALGGGKLWLSEFHHPAWGRGHIESLLPLLHFQSYISDAEFLPLADNDLHDWRHNQNRPAWLSENIDYDLHGAENDRNPEQFPEWDGRVWPGNCHIAKRYAVHFNVAWDPETRWLQAPAENVREGYHIIFHAPHRRLVRNPDRWRNILEQLGERFKLMIVGGKNDIGEWDDVRMADQHVPADFLETASRINSADLFLGAASSCNVIAEGLKQRRLVELAPDCFNTYPHGSTGLCINELDDEQVVEAVGGWLDRASTDPRNRDPL